MKKMGSQDRNFSLLLLPSSYEKFWGMPIAPCIINTIPLTQFLVSVFYSILIKVDFMYNNLRIAEVRVFAGRKA